MGTQLPLLQLAVVYPILMEQNQKFVNALEPLDILHLCPVHPYICDFISRHFENNQLNQPPYPWKGQPVSLEQLVEDKLPFPVPVPVLIRGLTKENLPLVQQFGSRILDCHLVLSDRSLPEQEIPQIVTCLHTYLPNLRNLLHCNWHIDGHYRTVYN